MSFLTNASSEDLWPGNAYEEYRAYLESVKDRLPQAVYEFASAGWHYDPTNPSCPHDAWIQEIKIRELSEHERPDVRTTQIEVILLGAYHDRLLRLTYKDVATHSLSSSQSRQGYGDWLIDEITLSPEDLIVHEVKFANEASFKIECRDITFEEQLVSQPYGAIWK